MDRENGLFQMDLLRIFMQLKNNIMDILSPVTSKYDLNLLDALVLYSVSEEHDLSMGDLYKSMNLNQGNLSSMCKKLEEKGYLIRNRDKKDQRTVILEITQKGEDTLGGINEEINKLYKIAQEIPQTDVKEAVNGLGCFADIIERIHSKIDD